MKPLFEKDRSRCAPQVRITRSISVRSGARAGATAAGGAGLSAMVNQNGVVIELMTTTQGVNLKLAVTGLNVSIQK